MMPLIAEGFDVDGSDISEEMIALARADAAKRGFSPTLTVQPMHEPSAGRIEPTCAVRGASVAAVTTTGRR